MKKQLFILLLLLPTLSFSQKMYEEKLSNCPIKFAMENDSYLINYLSNDSLMVVDFLADLEQKYVDRLKGVVMFQVMVDTAQQTCLISYTNKSTLSKKRLDMSNRLKAMPHWKRTDLVDDETNVCALFAIIFDKDQIHVQRTGYNRNTGKRVLDYSSFNRKEELPVKDSIPQN